MGSLEDLIAEAARLAQHKTSVKDRQAAARDDAVAFAQAEAMLARQTQDLVGMDACPLRAESVQHLTARQCMRRCRSPEPGHYTPMGRHIGSKTCVQTGQCYLCGKALEGTRQRWCSQECSNTWWRNHMWAMARGAAVKRDGNACVRCGAKEGAKLGCKCGDAACGRAGRSWGHSALTVALEVNHIEPRNGGGYAAGCHHHLANLETLCHDCHVIETTRQIRERKVERERKLLVRARREEALERDVPAVPAPMAAPVPAEAQAPDGPEPPVEGPLPEGRCSCGHALASHKRTSGRCIVCGCDRGAILPRAGERLTFGIHRMPEVDARTAVGYSWATLKASRTNAVKQALKRLDGMPRKEADSADTGG